MPLLSKYAQKKRIEYAVKDIPKQARILEVGCGNGWFGDYLKRNGWKNYVGLDIVPPADIVGDILDWRELGIKEGSFDLIIAFEVVEHVNCFQEFFDILKPGGYFIGSLNLDEPKTLTEPFTLTEELLERHLFSGWEKKFYKIRPKPMDDKGNVTYRYFYEDCPKEILEAPGPRALWCRMRVN